MHFQHYAHLGVPIHFDLLVTNRTEYHPADAAANGLVDGFPDSPLHPGYPFAHDMRVRTGSNASEFGRIPSPLRGPHPEFFGGAEGGWPPEQYNMVPYGHPNFRPPATPIDLCGSSRLGETECLVISAGRWRGDAVMQPPTLPPAERPLRRHPQTPPHAPAPATGDARRSAATRQGAERSAGTSSAANSLALGDISQESAGEGGILFERLLEQSDGSNGAAPAKGLTFAYFSKFFIKLMKKINILD